MQFYLTKQQKSNCVCWNITHQRAKKKTAMSLLYPDHTTLAADNWIRFGTTQHWSDNCLWSSTELTSMEQTRRNGNVLLRKSHMMTMMTMHESIEVVFSPRPTLPNIGRSENATLETDKLWSKHCFYQPVAEAIMTFWHIPYQLKHRQRHCEWKHHPSSHHHMADTCLETCCRFQGPIHIASKI